MGTTTCRDGSGISCENATNTTALVRRRGRSAHLPTPWGSSLFVERKECRGIRGWSSCGRWHQHAGRIGLDVALEALTDAGLRDLAETRGRRPQCRIGTRPKHVVDGRVSRANSRRPSSISRIAEGIRRRCGNCKRPLSTFAQDGEPPRARHAEQARSA